jgi:uncharacterized damage-inducible protein DinB
MTGPTRVSPSPPSRAAGNVSRLRVAHGEDIGVAVRIGQPDRNRHSKCRAAPVHAYDESGVAPRAHMAKRRPLELERELLEAFRHSGLVSEYLASVVPAGIWRAAPPGGRGRSIAAIVAHMQGVRRTFARMAGARPGPPSLDRRGVTPRQARRALEQSTDDLARRFEAALAAGQPRVKGMPRRAINMLVYLIQHDAHHRGQICMLARDLGHTFSTDDTMRLWGWKAIQFNPPPRNARHRE